MVGNCVSKCDTRSRLVSEQINMTIEITSQPRRFMVDGQPVEELDVAHSRFERIAIMRTEDGIVVRAKERDGSQSEYEMEMANKLFKGVIPKDTKRRDIDDDILDALFATGWAATDSVEADTRKVAEA